MGLVLIAALTIPLGLDLYMPVPEDNPITVENIELGRRLFADRRLSRDGLIACTSCHDPARAFSTPDAVSPGVFGRRGRRNSPALINRGWGKSFFWDGRVATLEEQVLKPIEDPNEMDLPVADAARGVGLTPVELSRALATYVRSIMSGNSPYDRYVNGERNALSPEQQVGLQIFRGRGNCTACHVGPNFTDERFHNTGIAWASEAGPAAGWPTDARSARAGQGGRLLDEGRAAITGKAEDGGAFKTPTLREIARTAPYMHDGSLATLEDVVDFYDRGGGANPNLDRELQPRRFTADEKRALVTFLDSLSGVTAR
jgi:cytochrome c peroxidase